MILDTLRKWENIKTSSFAEVIVQSNGDDDARNYQNDHNA